MTIISNCIDHFFLSMCITTIAPHSPSRERKRTHPFPRQLFLCTPHRTQSGHTASMGRLPRFSVSFRFRLKKSAARSRIRRGRSEIARPDGVVLVLGVFSLASHRPYRISCCSFNPSPLPPLRHALASVHSSPASWRARTSQVCHARIYTSEDFDDDQPPPSSYARNK